jgi:hypothetical protein
MTISLTTFCTEFCYNECRIFYVVMLRDDIQRDLIKLGSSQLLTLIEFNKSLKRNQKIHSFFWRHDTQRNDTQHNDTQLNDTQHHDTQHNGLICDTQFK